MAGSEGNPEDVIRAALQSRAHRYGRCGKCDAQEAEAVAALAVLVAARDTADDLILEALDACAKWTPRWEEDERLAFVDAKLSAAREALGGSGLVAAPSAETGQTYEVITANRLLDEAGLHKAYPKNLMREAGAALVACSQERAEAVAARDEAQRERDAAKRVADGYASALADRGLL